MKRAIFIRVGLRRDTTLWPVFIEHDVPLVSFISDRLVCMHLGGIIAAGDPEAVLTDPRLISSYLGESPETIARSGNLAGQEFRDRVQRRAGAWSSGRRPRP